MAHIVLIENPQGDITDNHYYCSDGCAQSDPNYAGWNGCYEIHVSPEWCGECGEALGYYRYTGADTAPEYVHPEVQWDEHESKQ